MAIMINVSFGAGSQSLQNVYNQRWKAHSDAVCCKRECQQFPNKYDGNKYKVQGGKCYCSVINDPWGMDGTWTTSTHIDINMCGCGKLNPHTGTNQVDYMCAGKYLAEEQPKRKFCDDIAEQLETQYSEHIHILGLKNRFYMDCLDTIEPGSCEKNAQGECSKCRHDYHRDCANCDWGGCCLDRYGKESCTDFKEHHGRNSGRGGGGDIFTNFFAGGSSITPTF